MFYNYFTDVLEMKVKKRRAILLQNLFNEVKKVNVKKGFYCNYNAYTYGECKDNKYLESWPKGCNSPIYNREKAHFSKLIHSNCFQESSNYIITFSPTIKQVNIKI